MAAGGKGSDEDLVKFCKKKGQFLAYRLFVRSKVFVGEGREC